MGKTKDIRTGTVPSYWQYKEVLAAARRVSGVTSAHNHLEVVLPPADYRDDPKLPPRQQRPEAEHHRAGDGGGLRPQRQHHAGRHRALRLPAARGRGDRSRADRGSQRQGRDRDRLGRQPGRRESLVQEALNRNALIGHDSDVKIDTSDGSVTLTGHVRTWAERDAVLEANWKTPAAVYKPLRQARHYRLKPPPSPMRRSGWLTFSAVMLIIAGVLRLIDAIRAFGCNRALPDNLQGALLGHGLRTYAWVWLFTGPSRGRPARGELLRPATENLSDSRNGVWLRPRTMTDAASWPAGCRRAKKRRLYVHWPATLASRGGGPSTGTQGGGAMTDIIHAGDGRDRTTARRTLGSRVRDSFMNSAGSIVFGMEDGTVSIFGLVFGVAVAAPDSRAVLLAGSTGAISAAVSMMAGTFLDVETANDQAASRMAEERVRYAADPQKANQDIHRRLILAGLTDKEAATFTGIMGRHPDTRLTIAAAVGLGEGEATRQNPYVQSAWMFITDLFAAAVPVVPFALLGLTAARLVSLTMTSLLLVLLGIGRAEVGRRRILPTIAQTVGIATAAAVTGLAVGKLIS